MKITYNLQYQMAKTNGYYVCTPSSGQLPKLNNCKLYNFQVCNGLLYRRSWKLRYQLDNAKKKKKSEESQSNRIQKSIILFKCL